MHVASIVDLDQRPELVRHVLELFQAAGPGRHHAICGIPVRMGQKPLAQDLANCLGTVVLLDGPHIAGALAICSYSEDQATLWGPVLAPNAATDAATAALVKEVRTACRDGGFSSMRALVDSRNRELRKNLLNNGFSTWKDSHVYERSLHRVPALPETVRPATKRDHAAAAAILAGAFPDSGHCLPSLAEREREGYRHYVALEDGLIVGAAAVQSEHRRAWIKLIAVRPDVRQRGTAKKLTSGILAGEAACGQREIGLEVLADNTAAITTFEKSSFRKVLTFSILTGPV